MGNPQEVHRTATMDSPSDTFKIQSNQYAIVPFDGKDFENWFFRVRTTLAELGLETILNEESNDCEWKSKDAKAKSVLVSCIADTHLDHVKGQLSAKAMMDNLVSKFGATSIAAQMSAWKKLLAMTYNGKSNLADYLTKFEGILKELELAGSQISDDYKICCILSSMPESYSSILKPLELAGSSLTLDQLKNKILGIQSQSKAYAVKNNSNNQIKCYYCSAVGHQRWNCKQLKKKWLKDQLSKTDGNGSQPTNTDSLSRDVKQNQSGAANGSNDKYVVTKSREIVKPTRKNSKPKKLPCDSEPAINNSQPTESEQIGNSETPSTASDQQPKFGESGVQESQNGRETHSGAMEAEGKTREEIKSQREAKKLAKLAKKNKTSAGDEENAGDALAKGETAVGAQESAQQKPKNVDGSSNSESNSPAKKSNAELKAERRQKQEAQRALKEALKKDVADINKAATSSQPAQNAAKKSTKQSQLQEKIPEAGKPTAKSTLQVAKTAPVSPSQPKLLSHLQIPSKLPPQHIYQNVHPAIVELGAQYAARVVSGSNARCVALLHALKKVIADFTTPREKEFSRAMEGRLNDSMTYLNYCRQASVSMTNALKHVKSHLTQLATEDISDEEARRKLLDAIDTFIKEQIDVAGEAICNSIAKKISDGDTIAIYGCSSLLLRILVESHNEGKDFEVVVVDGGPLYEGREMCRRLAAENIKCTYVLLPAFSYVVGQTTKVLLGAHALLANGCVMSRSGTALVAMIAKAHNVAVIVCCETYKFCERAQADAFVHNELGPPNNGKGPPSFSLMYDITPPSLVDAVATELAILPCTSVPVVLRLKPSDVSPYYY